MNIYLGSDWHFSKEAKNGKPFRMDPKKNEKILKNYKRIISDDDVFIFLGDLGYFGTENPEIINYQIKQIKTLPGKKIMIRGNNDYEDKSFYTKTMNFDVCKDFLKVGNFIFTHDPISLNKKDIEKGYINIHGHIHGSKTYWSCNPVNHVDCYTNHYDLYPVTLENALYGDLSFVNYNVSKKEIRNLYTKLINY